jgi:hypothetical protein
MAGPANRHHLTVFIIVEHWNINFIAPTPNHLHVSFNGILQVMGEKWDTGNHSSESQTVFSGTEGLRMKFRLLYRRVGARQHPFGYRFGF